MTRRSEDRVSGLAEALERLESFADTACDVLTERDAEWAAKDVELVRGDEALAGSRRVARVLGDAEAKLRRYRGHVEFIAAQARERRVRHEVAYFEAVTRIADAARLIEASSEPTVSPDELRTVAPDELLSMGDREFDTYVQRIGRDRDDVVLWLAARESELGYLSKALAGTLKERVAAALGARIANHRASLQALDAAIADIAGEAKRRAEERERAARMSDPAKVIEELERRVEALEGGAS